MHFYCAPRRSGVPTCDSLITARRACSQLVDLSERRDRSSSRR
jgi:hypothetical protein